MTFERYLQQRERDVPQEVYLSLLGIFVVGSTIFLCWKGKKRGAKLSLYLLGSEYIFLIYCITVIYRRTKDICKFDLTPFWSWREIFNGKMNLMHENIMNIVMFVPIGLLVGVLFSEYNWKRILLIGTCISIGIEILQFIFSKGFSEFDDVMHNALGCMVGFLIVCCFSKRPNKLSI